MTVMDIAEILANTLSPENHVREQATRSLEAMSAENFPEFMGLLCQQLANEQVQLNVRHSAGLFFKNLLSSRTGFRQNELNQRWLSVDPNFRSTIKAGLVHTLSSPISGIGIVIGQAISAVAAIELPRGEWLDLIPSLLERLTANPPDNVKQSILTTIGFICESIQSEVLANQANAILSAVAHGASKDQANPAVRVAALQALINSVEFISQNFERENERNYVMLIVCEATQSDNEDLQVIAFECLVKLMASYYDYMSDYMSKAIYGLTTMGMRHESSRVALQAIELWSTVAELEYEIIYEIQEARDCGIESKRMYFNFVGAAASQIVPVLLWLMTKKEEDDDEDDWNVPMSASTCLGLFAQCQGSTILPLVLPSIEANITNENWQFREAAVMAFGCILEGPEPEELGKLVQAAFGTLLQLMTDPVLQVRDTAIWTVGRICQTLMPFINAEEFPRMISLLIKGLNDNPRIAATCTLVFVSLAENLSNVGEVEYQDSSPVSAFFKDIISALTARGENPSTDSNLRMSVYEAISNMVQYSPNDCKPLMSELTSHILQRLEASVVALNQSVSAEEREATYEFQSNLCSVLVSIIRRVKTEILAISDDIMRVVLGVLSSSSKKSTSIEDALLVVGALASVMEEGFVRYAEAFMPILYTALQSHTDHHICSIAVGIAGDVCRALGEQISPYSDTLMNIIGNLLANSDIDPNLRPVIVSFFGDMALAIGGKFEAYLLATVHAINQVFAETTTLPQSTLDQLEFVQFIYESIAEAYVGILQGLKAGDKSQLILQSSNVIMQFAHTAVSTPNRPETLARQIAGLIGDLAEALPPGTLKPVLSEAWISEFLREVRSTPSISPLTKEMVKYARDRVRRHTQV